MRERLVAGNWKMHGSRESNRALLANARFLRGSLRALSGAIRLGVAEVERGAAELASLPAEDQRWTGLQAGLATLAALVPADERAPPVLPLPETPGAPYRGSLVNWRGNIGRYR